MCFQKALLNCRAFITGAAATLTQGRLIRQLVNKNSQSLNKCFALISSNTEYGITSTVTNTVNINTASDFWVVATAQLGNSGDTGILSNIQTYISKP